ncbi:protein apterous isoform X1 [Lutzomyia longipalpis]|nr:protein apterous isoform X1 [Lutzomyia longipalpis]
MGVCNEERPVMHWQQSARFFGPTRERSPTLPIPVIGGQCTNRNNNHPLHRPCASCLEPCEHIGKPFGPNQVYPDSCRSNYKSPEHGGLFEDASLSYTDLPKECLERTSVPTGSGGAASAGSTSMSDQYLQLKAEPAPSSPESSSDVPSSSPDDCAGCGQLIQDRFYLSAVEKRWHAGCLQCCMCRQLLEGETSCYSRDENIYCKTDYYRVFGTRRCSRCMATISSSELVMRARHLVFHVRCFSCAVCNTPLTKGDHFGMRESTVLCRLHYEISLETEALPTTTPMTMACQHPQPFGTSPLGPPSPSDGATKLGPSGFFGGSQHNLTTALTHPPRQKGRPRKRKPKDIEAMTANLDLNSEYLDLSYGRGGPGGLNASSRTKRMRTSFKHHQLRTMKSYFAINHNPDAKDLKQLSQKTGLPKRVLQVWFQNARAKWRRMMMKQEGKGGGGEKGDISLDLDSYSSHSPSFMLGGPHSPHSID